ncbi:YebG family protein [Celerinatantimonas sp. MCCC 1A17872]|uniref:YebG family protein n=1 Tax=Celerinatantimonas sp. MCCC 1A17872 TaxID=3177514 RepID=UPI0038C36109
MAVVVKYVVERDGVEKMTFTSKKEADAYDKMLDIADQFALFLRQSEVKIDESQAEELGFFIANNRNCVNNLLKGREFEINMLSGASEDE